MKRKVAILASIVGPLLLLSTSANLLQAQDVKTGLQLSPISYEVEVVPGGKFNEEIRLTNVSGRNVKVQVSVEDFIAGGEKGEPKILVGEEEGASKWSLRHWVSLEETRFELQKDEAKLFPFDVNVPSDAEPGGHYGVVRFTSSAPQTGEEGVAISGSVGSLVLLRIKGDIRETGKIIDFYSNQADDSKLKKSSFFERGPVGFELRFRNTGNVHYKPKGVVEVVGLWGKKTRVALEERNVLPESVRRFDTEWKVTPSIGRFTAQATMTYGSQDKPVKSKKITFYLIPWKIVLAVLFVLLIFLTLIWRQIKISRKLRMIEAKTGGAKGRKSG